MPFVVDPSFAAGWFLADEAHEVATAAARRLAVEPARAPQLFRYERQQKGRLREHFQFNADLIGENDPAADAELIALVIDTLRSFGLTAEDFVIRLSSRNAWHDFFKAGSADATREYDFFQAIDKLERATPAENEEKLAALGFSLAGVNAFVEAGAPTAELSSIIGNLAARGLQDFVKIDYRVIRGLAYYTGVVFEALTAKASSAPSPAVAATTTW